MVPLIDEVLGRAKSICRQSQAAAMRLRAASPSLLAVTAASERAALSTGMGTLGGSSGDAWLLARSSPLCGFA